MRPLRIAYVDYVLEPDKPGRSGLSDIVWDMATALSKLGHEAHVVGSYSTTQYPNDTVIVHNFPTPPIGYRNVLGNMWLLKRASKVISQIRPDIVHTPEYFSTAILYSLGTRVPLVLTVPGNIYHKLSIPHGSGYEWYWAQILKWAAKVSARRCSRVIAISREMKEWWEWTGSIPENTPFIPLGVDPKRFCRVKNAREVLGLDIDKTTLAYIGRFSIEKGVVNLLTSLSQSMIKRSPNTAVVLIGKGPLESSLRNMVSHAGLEETVTIVSWVPSNELKLWYSAVDAVLLPSLSEAMGRVIPEAFMCGTPVIASHVAGARDHINAERGVTFPAGDFATLSKIIDDLITNPSLLEGMGDNALRYAEMVFPWSAVMARIIDEVYYPILSNY